MHEKLHCLQTLWCPMMSFPDRLLGLQGIPAQRAGLHLTLQATDTPFRPAQVPCGQTEGAHSAVLVFVHQTSTVLATASRLPQCVSRCCQTVQQLPKRSRAPDLILELAGSACTHWPTTGPGLPGAVIAQPHMVPDGFQ